MLFNEPKLLKSILRNRVRLNRRRFSALQRAEIAEIIRYFLRYHIRAVDRFSALQRAEIAEIVVTGVPRKSNTGGFSALQRAEIAEIWNYVCWSDVIPICFSALQRAEIAEIVDSVPSSIPTPSVSVLFNEPKLLKLGLRAVITSQRLSFSALQRAEIAEIAFHYMLIAP